MTTISTPALNWRLIRYQPLVFALHCTFHIIFLAAPIALGLIERAIFDGLAGAAQTPIWWLVAAYAGVGVARLAAHLPDNWAALAFKRRCDALLRANLLAGQLARPGAVGLPVPVGEAINRYGDDVAEVCDFPTWLPHVAGYLVAFVLAIAIMARIDLTITLAVFLPLFLTTALSRTLWGRFQRSMERENLATDKASGFYGEVFGAALAIKVAAAEPQIIANAAALNRVRGDAAVHKQLLWSVLESSWRITSVFGIAVVLLLAGGSLSAGRLTVGDFALFVTYLWYTTDIPALLGTFVGDYQKQRISIDRLLGLIPDLPPLALVKLGEGWPTSDEELVVNSQSSVVNPHGLEVSDLTCQYPSGGGVVGVSFTLARGGLTVVTGKVGSGKTTLLRAILGLLPAQGGTVRWAGRVIEDPAAVFVPPLSAYTPQVPRLVSETLRENILLGCDPARLPQALHLAVLEPDVARLERGLETRVGPRGIRLSGGQAQRAAAARMFVREPELLVFDDLSSALDVTTEQLLWQRIAALRTSPRSPTLLVVSHRREVLGSADQVLVLDDGRVADCGPAAALLARSAAFRAIWDAEA